METTFGICALIAIVSIGLLIAAWLRESRPRREAWKAMIQRPPLTDEEFGREFFPADQALLATFVRRSMAQHYGQDFSRLHPDDRLDVVLPLSHMDSLDSVELLMEIEGKLGMELPEASLSGVTTFRDLINALQAAGPGCAPWQQKLGRLVEERFGVELSREELARVRTPGTLVSLLTDKLHGQVQQVPICPSQQSFYLLRNALIELRCGSRGMVKLDTPLHHLIPARKVRDIWPRLRDAVNARYWPELVRPRWLTRLVIAIPILLSVAAALWLPVLSEWLLGWSELLGMIAAFLSELRGLTVPLLVIAGWVVGSRISRRWTVAFPRKIRTVRDLVPLVETSPQVKWTRAQIAEQIQQIVVENLHAPREKYRLDVRFVEDLGFQECELCFSSRPAQDQASLART